MYFHESMSSPSKLLDSLQTNKAIKIAQGRQILQLTGAERQWDAEELSRSGTVFVKKLDF